MLQTAETYVLLAPPGFDTMKKAEKFFEGVDARLINLDQVLE